MSYNTLNLFAPAKVNLFLHITGKREDGYHLLQTVMVFLDIGDDIELAPYDGLYLDTIGEFAAPLNNPRDNLIYKAAIALAAEYNITPKAKITLTKNLPLSSGLGGGSADAAATLRGLSKLWGLDEEPKKLMRIAQRLGADVPACLNKKAVWVEGIGDTMSPLASTPLFYLVLVNPLIPTLTTDVFNAFRGRINPPLQFSGRRKSEEEWLADLKIYRNDLTDAAIGITPAIADVLVAIAKTPGCLLHRMSGSGASCFGIYNSAEAAHIAEHVLKTKHPEWWIHQARITQ